MPIKLNASHPLLPIVKQEIHDLITEYAKTCADDDAKSCWVSKDEIMQVLTENNGTGIRLYYGRHSKSTQEAVGYEYMGMHTVILVATIDCTNPSNPTTENSDDQLNDIPENGLVNSATYTTSYKGLGGDYVPLCPPRCPKPPTQKS